MLSLIKGLDALKRFTPTRSVLPIIEGVCIRNGWMVATNLEATIMVKTDIKGSVVVPFAVLEKAAKKTAKLNHYLVIDGPKAILKHDKGELSFACDQEVDDFPSVRSVLDEVASQEYVSIDAGMEAIKKAMKFTHTDADRGALCGVQIQKDAVVGTNAHYLYWKDIDLSSLDSEINLPNVKGQMCAKAVVELGLSKVKTAKTNNIFTNEEETVILITLDAVRNSGKYPDWRNVIPQDHSYSATFDKKEMQGAIDRLLITANKTTHQIVFDCNGSLNLSTEDLDFGNEAKETVNAKSEIRIAFNGKLFLDVLKEIDTSKATIELSAPNRAAILNKEILIIPIMLNTNY